jgi:uncharacterized membrane protein
MDKMKWITRFLLATFSFYMNVFVSALLVWGVISFIAGGPILIPSVAVFGIMRVWLLIAIVVGVTTASEDRWKNSWTGGAF